ncbi:DUF6059 family protein [Streptomyces sp. NBC_01794]|uniref:DUF6059 family protein n=1 Tax=unclassified Streptomyces TaxID=2593676 RepID=UPI003872C8AD
MPPARDATSSRAAAGTLRCVAIRGIRRIAVDRLLPPVWNGLVALGMLYAAAGRAPAEPPLAGPPEGHPERVRADVPLTVDERTLARCLPPLRRPEQEG